MKSSLGELELKLVETKYYYVTSLLDHRLVSKRRRIAPINDAQILALEAGVALKET